MDDSESKSDEKIYEEPNVSPPRIFKFVSTGLFEHINRIIGKSAFFSAICLIGAKQVGKSTTLQSLYLEQKKKHKRCFKFDLCNRMSSEMCKAEVQKLEVIAHQMDQEASNPQIDVTWLFIDNIHLAAYHPELQSMVYMFAKQAGMYSYLARLVCASSRHGLVYLRDCPVNLNCNDFITFVVNPFENVTRTLIEQSDCELFTKHKVETEDLLVYTGFLPGIVPAFVSFAERSGTPDGLAAFEAFKKDRRVDLLSAIDGDLKRCDAFSVPRQRAYVKALALCATGGLSPLQLMEAFGLAREWLAWTFLKQEDGGQITSLSPLARSVAGLCLAQNTTTIELTLKLLKSFEMRDEGIVRGYMFENFVAWAMVRARGKLTLLRGDQSESEIDLTKPFLRTMELTAKKLAGGFKIDENVCYVTKQMEGVDIILSLKNNEVYFVQCTVSVSLLSSKASFWKTAPKDWKCVLLTPYDAKKVTQRILESQGTLSSEFKEGKFYVSDALELLSAGEIESVKGNHEF